MKMKIVTLSEYDRKILHMLDSNGRESVANITKQLCKGREFVLYRLNRLKKAGVYTKIS
ncbi:TPA: Lrp/AsnC family transcriptional regulator [Candidatus Woesearchaeota archaeon]|nr:Lrp/AsnC family transcriptional regulator [Candidatus Woesearchaeota archaeon]